MRAPYEHVWLFGRTLVYGKSDLGAAHRIQDGYKAIPLAAFERVGLAYRPPTPSRVVTTPTDHGIPTGIAFYDKLGDELATPRRLRVTTRSSPRWPPPGSDGPASLERAPFPDTLAGLTAAANGGPAHVFALRVQFGTTGAKNGWFQTLPDTGNWGTHYAYRAVVAVYGICANRPAQATDGVTSRDSTGAALNGSDSYRIHFSPGQIPLASTSGR